MAIISDVVAKIRQAIYGKDVRENIASGIEAINKEVESTTSKQASLDTTFKQLIINAGNSNAEVVAARGTYTTLQNRLDNQGYIADNILVNSDFERNVGIFFGYTGVGCSINTDFSYQGTKSLKITQNSLANGGVIGNVPIDIINLCKGKKVTLSFKVRGINSSIGKEINAVIGWEGSGAYGTKIPVTEDWQTIYVTTTLPINTIKMQLYISTTLVVGDIIYADNCKLEIGDLGLWKPNMEDTDAALALKQTKTDSNLKTVDKTTTGAINEINSKIPNIWYHGMHSTDRSILEAIGVLKNTEIMLKKDTKNSIACVEYIKYNCMVHDASLGSYFKAPESGYYTFKGMAYLSPGTNTPSYTATFLKIYNIDTTESHIITRSNLIGGMSEEFSFIITAYMLANQRIRFNVLNIAASSDTVTAGINQLTIIKETI